MLDDEPAKGQMGRITLVRMVAALVVMQAVTIGVLAILILQSAPSLCHF